MKRVFPPPLTGFFGYWENDKKKRLSWTERKTVWFAFRRNLGNLSPTLQMFLVHYLFHNTAKLPRNLKNQRCCKNYPWIFIVNLDCELIKPVGTTHVQFAKCGYVRYILTFFMIPSVDNTLKHLIYLRSCHCGEFFKSAFFFRIVFTPFIDKFCEFFLDFSKRIVCAVNFGDFFYFICKCSGRKKFSDRLT